MAQDFFQKPFRSFFDLKRQAYETYLRYVNVTARAEQIKAGEDNRRIVVITTEEEERLRDAEAALRDYGTRFTAFAQTEKATLPLLRWYGYDPAQIGSNFFGLSNSIGEYGSHRNHYSELVKKSLKVTI